LHNHTCLIAGRAVVRPDKDYIHLRGILGPSEAVEALEEAVGDDIKFLCVNDLPALLKRAPDARKRIARAITPKSSGVIPSTACRASPTAAAATH